MHCLRAQDTSISAAAEDKIRQHEQTMLLEAQGALASHQEDEQRMKYQASSLIQEVQQQADMMLKEKEEQTEYSNQQVEELRRQLQEANQRAQMAENQAYVAQQQSQHLDGRCGCA